MGQIKHGLDYFPFDIGLLSDRKFRRVKLKYGHVAVIIYLSLLELIYKDKGYFIIYNEFTKNDIIWDILNNLQGKFQPTAETVDNVIEDLVSSGLFSIEHFKSKIITSRRIQLTYYSATVERKAVDIDVKIWLLSLNEMEKISKTSSILRFFYNRPNETANRPNETANRPNETESKEKEIKDIITLSSEKNFEEALICKAKNLSIGKDNPNKYEKAILQNWAKKGIFTLEAWEKNQKISPKIASSQHTLNERHYTDEELDHLIINLDDIDF